jgi:hypothetical protein
MLLEGETFDKDGVAGVAAGAGCCSTCNARIASRFFLPFSSAVTARLSTALSNRPNEQPDKQSQTLIAGGPNDPLESTRCCMAPFL